MHSLSLFTDVSLNPQRQLGVGAFLLVPSSFLERMPDQIKREEVAARLCYRRFTATSSTQLEVQTVLWALDEYGAANTDAHAGPLQVYTDSQCVVGLPGRRSGLESASFIARRSGKPLCNAALYGTFYATADKLNVTLIKVAGHAHSSSHNTVQRVFAHVDREVRRALRRWLAEI